MRRTQLSVNGTDSVHVFSDDQHIWLQLRRNVPTEHEIGRPSFKTALHLTPETAHKLGLELLNVADRNKEKQSAKNCDPKVPAIKPASAKPKQPQAKSASAL